MTLHAIRRHGPACSIAFSLSLAVMSAYAALGDQPNRRRAPQPAEAKTPAISSAPVKAAKQIESTKAADSAAASANGFNPDRRPVRAINMFNGNPKNPHGLQDKWNDDDATAIEWLKGELERNHAKGYTRFVFILPAGVDRSIDPTTNKPMNMPSSHWLPMAPSRRHALKEFVLQWLPAHLGVTLGLYTAFDLDPNPHDINFVGHTTPRFENESDRNRVYELIRPWVEEIGMTEIWWDLASSPQRRENALKFSQWLAERGVRAGGEAAPRTLPNYDGTLDASYTQGMPWMALTNYFRKFDPKQQWRVDPTTTEVFIGMRGGDNTPTDQEIISAIQRGFIPWVYAYSLEDRAMNHWNTVQPQQGSLQAPAKQNANPATKQPLTPDPRSRRRR